MPTMAMRMAYRIAGIAQMIRRPTVRRLRSSSAGSTVNSTGVPPGSAPDIANSKGG